MFKFNLNQVVHQGDVFITKISNAVEKLTGTPIQPEQTGLVVQHGEAIGHYHRVADPTAAQLNLVTLDSGVKKMLLAISKETALIHEEHAPITLTTGTYEITTQREQRQGLIRPVLD